MIKLMVIGHLGKDAESRNVNGRQVISFNVAHSERYKDSQGNMQNKTIWVSCSYWTDSPNIIQYLKKGTQVYVEGQPSVDAYMSTAQNQPAANLNLRINKLELLGSSGQERDTRSNGATNYEKSAVAPPPVMAQEEDDLPF